MRPVSDAYEARVGRGELVRDAAQAAALAELDRLQSSLVEAAPPARGFRRRWETLLGRTAEPVKGLYLWGDVGRGKTFLMDLFFAGLPFEDKLRRHFHRFMAGVHRELKTLRSRSDPLEIAAERLAARARIVCFDELAVTDIADAMILGTLFKGLFERGVTLAATSNTPPRALYRDGLQRRRFEPAIDLIERHTNVLELDGPLDYRLQFLERADVYQTPAGEKAEAQLADYFEGISPDEGDTGGEIDILGRPITYRRRADGVIWFEFEAICAGPRSQDDYIELSRSFQTVLVSNVPRFTAAMENEARRFVALVDEFYDRRVKLILSAEAPIAGLYAGSRLIHEFTRTRSRLEEMRSHDYLASGHRA